jgi:hypothetical protein
MKLLQPFRYAFVLAAAILSQSVPAQSFIKSGQTTIDSRGMTLQSGATYGEAINGLAFQFDAITTFQGWQYAAYYVKDPSAGKSPYYAAIARRKLPDGQWQIANLKSCTFRNGLVKGVPDDAHNVISIGICPNDGTIHISWDMHGHDLNYRTTDPGVATHPESVKWGEAVFHPRTDALGNSGLLRSVTYPMFVQTPSGDMQLFFRTGGSGIGENWVYDYDGKSHQWIGGRQFDTRNGKYNFTTPDGVAMSQLTRNNYPNGYNYDANGRLHTTFVWREGKPNGSGANHDINYAYSDDRGISWKNNAGQIICDTTGAGGLPKQFDVHSQGLVIDPLSMFRSLMNTQAQAIDSQNQPHVLMWHLDGDAKYLSTWDNEHSSYHHLWRGSDGVWHTTKISRDIGGGPPGSRPRMVIDPHDNVFAIYTVRTAESLGKTGLYFRDGKLIIAEATKAGGWADWKIVATESGPFVNEPLADFGRFAQSQVLTVMMQASPTSSLVATPVETFDFSDQ